MNLLPKTSKSGVNRTPEDDGNVECYLAKISLQPFNVKQIQLSRQSISKNGAEIEKDQTTAACNLGVTIDLKLNPLGFVRK